MCKNIDNYTKKRNTQKIRHEVRTRIPSSSRVILQQFNRLGDGTTDGHIKLSKALFSCHIVLFKVFLSVNKSILDKMTYLLQYSSQLYQRYHVAKSASISTVLRLARNTKHTLL